MNALWIAAGVGAWAVHFGLVYAIVTLACAYGATRAAVVGVVVATLAGLAAAAGLVVHGYRERRQFVGWMSAGVAVAAAWAMIYEAIGVFFLPPCGS